MIRMSPDRQPGTDHRPLNDQLSRDATMFWKGFIILTKWHKFDTNMFITSNTTYRLKGRLLDLKTMYYPSSTDYWSRTIFENSWLRDSSRGPSVVNRTQLCRVTTSLTHVDHGEMTLFWEPSDEDQRRPRVRNT